MKQFFLFSLMLAMVCSCKSQTNVVDSADAVVTFNQNTDKPKLIVAIVVDQMRYDYLTRFESKYGNGGFKRLISEGYNCKNNHFNYIPTKTAAGHASIFSGTTPRNHGVIGNSWFDKDLKKNVYCVRDDAYQPIGTDSDDGKMSPHRMKTTTFADENRLFTQMKGKTIGISIKDRGAVLPAGHTGNAAYWFRGMDEGRWISSSFYLDKLPKWVDNFNKSDKVKSYLKTWNTLYPIETYVESGPDFSGYEDGFVNNENATFPYDLVELSKENDGFDILKSTPYGNSLTTDFALSAIDGEQLGKDDFTDVLTISYSSTDYVGHNFGVIAKETQDTYLRLDLDIERLLIGLDNKVGKGQYTVFLTADHGAPYVPSYLNSKKVPAGLFDFSKAKKELNQHLLEKFNASDLILSTYNEQIFLDHAKINTAGLELNSILNTITTELLKYNLIDKVFKGSDINNLSFTDGVESMLKNGYNQKRSGDLVIVLNSSVFGDGYWNKKGTDHGSGYQYDTHVPLIFYGHGIRKGETLKKTQITDIAPTMSALLGISFPNAATGKVLDFVID